MMTSYPLGMVMDPDAKVPHPGVLADYANSYGDDAYRARSNPIDLLRLGQVMRDALRRYDDQLVYAARAAGATWQEIGEALGMERQNAQRKYSHLPQPPR